MKIQRICILGGSGFVGTQLVSQLAARGLHVRVLSHRREMAKELILLPTVEVVEADVHDQQALIQNFRGMDAVINLVGILHEDKVGRIDLPSARRGDFQKVHVELVRKLIHAMGEAGVHRLLHMSALGADPNSRSAYQRSKGIGEALVREAGMRHSEHENWYLNGPKFIHGYGLDVTIFRPSVIFGRGDSFLSMFARLLKTFPVVPLAAAGSRFAPVYVEDVAHAFADSLDNPATFGQTYPLCGPKTYTLGELVAYVGNVIGKKRSIVALGPWMSYFQAWALEFKPGRKLMTRDNYYAMTTDNVCSGGWPAVFAFQPASLEAIAPEYLRADTPRARYEDYRESAHR
ncbi:complex I NDUFA9 subunit family protein [Thiobacillus sedimenti]|uniref:Complex I NDUFA9 subunit family protein n=1 Tax=Thiobacillus sedimenti TaxID=3110231 RepID=A0ABZ1CIB9_9PROT|nr:complex I NDUFA9 subunit family protein [Thiobacillus sp. SCUT-2]WRS38825.1 complex I NDUFA9 subunit family protein [Thiobacillus sp. SCUT-2]